MASIARYSPVPGLSHPARSGKKAAKQARDEDVHIPQDAGACPDGTVPACDGYIGFSAVPCLCRKSTTAMQCTKAGAMAELTIHRIESMAHMWLHRFGLRKVTEGLGMAKYREAGLRTAGLSEVFVPMEDWQSSCDMAYEYVELHADALRVFMSSLEGLLSVGARKGICGLAEQEETALFVGRIASSLAWNGLSAPEHRDAAPEVFGEQHATWHSSE